MALFWEKLLKTVCFGPKWLYVIKSSSKLCVLAKMVLFWQKMLKTLFCAKWLEFGKGCSKLCVFCQNGLSLAKAAQDSGFDQNGFILANDAQNSGLGQNTLIFPKLLKTVCFGKSCSKLCVLAEMALFWQKLLKTVCFGRNGFILTKAA